MDDGFHYRDDEAVLGVRATMVFRLGGEVRLLMIAAPAARECRASDWP
jgi:hypothetical protein